jgi:hypothetical protein
MELTCRTMTRRAIVALVQTTLTWPSLRDQVKLGRRFDEEQHPESTACAYRSSPS